MSGDRADGRDGAADAADAAWARVRRLAEKAAAMRPVDADLHPGLAERRARALLRAERATQKALLADELADAIAQVRRARDARVEEDRRF